MIIDCLYGSYFIVRTPFVVDCPRIRGGLWRKRQASSKPARQNIVTVINITNSFISLPCNVRCFVAQLTKIVLHTKQNELFFLFVLIDFIKFLYIMRELSIQAHNTLPKNRKTRHCLFLRHSLHT